MVQKDGSGLEIDKERTASENVYDKKGMMSHDFCVCFMQHVGLDLVTKDAI
ncbi:hypothetical protein YC2023_044568 [Brassica napus]